MNIAVVYLARSAEGPYPVRKFIDSYKRHPAGIAHDLVVVWKGFPNRDPAGSAQKAICDEVEHRSIAMSDEGFDITAYKLAAEAPQYDHVCFLNTFSEIESDQWLRKLHGYASRDDVGIAGSTGSLESIRETVKDMSRAVWLCHQGIPHDPIIAEQWGHEIAKYIPKWLERPPMRQRVVRALLKKAGVTKPIDYRQFDPAFELFWAKAGAPYEKLPWFPNPHIRSNSFMMQRTLFLDTLPPTIATKEDCFEFESGRTSVTNKVEQKGLFPVVVGADGEAYHRSNWSSSATFRSGAQENLLISDNQTREFEAMPLARKELYEQWTWRGPDKPRISKLPSHTLPIPFSPEMFI